MTVSSSWSSSDCSAASAPSLGMAASTRSRRLVPNSRSSNLAATSATLASLNAKSSGPTSRSMSVIIWVSLRFICTCSMRSRKLLPTTPLISSACSTKDAKSPYLTIHLVAVFSPTFGMPGKLSEGSPRNAAKSGYCAGVRPYFSSTAEGVKRWRVDTPFMG